MGGVDIRWRGLRLWRPLMSVGVPAALGFAIGTVIVQGSEGHWVVATVAAVIAGALQTLRFWAYRRWVVRELEELREVMRGGEVR